MNDVEVCRAFLEAFTARDFSKIESLLRPQFRFRALVPGPWGEGDLRTAQSAAGTVKYLRTWFGDADHFEVMSTDVYRVGKRYQVMYRVRMHDSDGWGVYEQRMWIDVVDQKVVGMDLLCSGNVEEPPAQPA